jgi:multidrug efflux pump subunit AcrA (membrane-fusion protein)
LGIAFAVLLGGGGVLYLARTGFSRITSAAIGEVPVHEAALAPFTRTISAEGYLRPVKSTPMSAPTESRSTLIEWVLEDGTLVKKGDLLVRFDDTDFARTLLDNQDEKQAAEHKITKEKTQIASQLSERDRSAALTREEIGKAKELGKKDPRFFPRNEVIESEIDEGLLRARLAQTEAVKKVEERLAHTRVALIAVERQKAEIERRNAQAALRGLELRAPHDGTWVLQRWGANRTLQAGDRAYSGMRIGEVAEGREMDAEVFVLESDAGGLVQGKVATVVLEARPDQVRKAIVKQVDPFPKPRTSEIPLQYFGTILGIHGDVGGAKPGQRLRASITLEEIPRALSVPRQAVFRGEKGPFVHRQRGAGEFEEVKVKLGPSTVSWVVIASGLAPGDRLALRDPKRSADETFADDPKRAAGRGGRSGGGPSGDVEGVGRGRRGR